MGNATERFLTSKAVRLAVALAWTYTAGEFWYRAITEGFRALRTSQVVLATALLVVMWASYFCLGGSTGNRDSSE